MISFRLKIVISMISLSLIAFVMGASTTRSILLNLFEDVVAERNLTSFRRDVGEYYATYGSWRNAQASETFEEYRERTQKPPPSLQNETPPSFVATDLIGKVWVSNLSLIHI